MADYEPYILREELRKRNPKAVHEPSIERLRDKRYYEGYFLEMLKLKRPPSFSPAQDGTPIWWERKARKQYVCSGCQEMILKGERYIGRRKLSPGVRGRYGYRGTYKTDCCHIVCLLEIAQIEAGKKIKKAFSEIDELKTQIASLKGARSQSKRQIEYYETAKQRAKRDYEMSTSWRRLPTWIGYKYTSWSKDRMIHDLETEIIHIENREIPIRENRVDELNGKINALRSWQTKLKKASRDYISPPRGRI